ncbi:ABC transporter ATP-binding protein [Cytophaga hutchinsonii]|jgi:ABC-2 type transport system ATP-binding protein|uniref:ABC transporter, ATP-binding protein GldA-related gliding motility protein n=1 Tax=Cytophaga hutchinsonii (strain ATCC 33406 / DSM 1761 / CIP 103989 / NBRC 15051 / NCIMB 9469 / D465) TaxID=269798 RepID=A0A6N4SN43_CYTH3|nr:ABC transporter ATP-binding protein [Cytophaga hutchinsonii]ABG57677.1 ABC transporter, ATP-binding protein; GldA-related gliding motility protein [Cytophaga hutchinsonii ATCC 33406]SFX02681.1 ABC-2 type transport system ATP-binding protein [Cytophaga hutchinsonii ATCC 33406]
MAEITNPAITISNLSFHYTENSGVYFNDFNLTVFEGERFGLFGPNGAGKSTLISLMTGLLKPVSGVVTLFNEDIHAKCTRKLFGFVPQDFSLYDELSPIENLQFFGAWAGLSKKEITNRTTELLDILGLTDVKHKAVKTFSGGMKRRVNLAIGVIHQPRILFLDEPTVGVDIQTRHAIIEYLKQLNKAGMTLVYTSHQLAEAESLCNRIALIDNGQLIACNDIPDLLASHHEEDLESLFLHLTGKAFRD